MKIICKELVDTVSNLENSYERHKEKYKRLLDAYNSLTDSIFSVNNIFTEKIKKLNAKIADLKENSLYIGKANRETIDKWLTGHHSNDDHESAKFKLDKNSHCILKYELTKTHIDDILEVTCNCGEKLTLYI